MNAPRATQHPLAGRPHLSEALDVVPEQAVQKISVWRVVSAVVCLLALWAAYLQLNDPDPERWFAMYAACGAVALTSALGRGRAPLAVAVGALALLWACAIVPELFGRWTPADLGASMSSGRPEVEYGRELGGLSLVAAYCAAAWFVERRRAGVKAPQHAHV
jgi:hypothetical protein